MAIQEKKVFEIDHNNLREVLSKITSELSIPYLQRRAYTNSHKANPVEELTDTIKELFNREKELRAATGIANILLENNEALENECNRQKESVAEQKGKKAQFKEKVKLLQQRTRKLENKLDEEGRNLLKLKKELSESNENRDVLAEKIQQLKYVSATESSDEMVIHELYGETTDLKGNFYIETLKSLKKELVKEKALRKSIRGELEKTRNLNVKETKEKSLMSSRTTGLEHKLSICSKRAEELEDFNEEISRSNEKQKRKIETLKTKLTTLEAMKKNQLSSQAHRNSLSISFTYSANGPNDEVSTDLGVSSLESEFQQLQTVPSSCAFSTSVQLDVSVLAMSTRKSPSEEYFHLVLLTQTSQAVKINSPYMDAICTESTKNLYHKVMTEKVPFHKWSTWIEDQLTSSYILSLYNTKQKAPPKHKKRSIIPFRFFSAR